MSSERRFVTLMGQKVRSVAPRANWERVENLVNAGTPDVNYCINGVEGWIEFKYKALWPRRLSTIVRLPKYTMTQRAWLRGRVLAGGNAWLFLQIARDYFLFPGPVAVAIVGKVNAGQLMIAAHRHWTDSVSPHSLVTALISPTVSRI